MTILAQGYGRDRVTLHRRDLIDRKSLIIGGKPMIKGTRIGGRRVR